LNYSFAGTLTTTEVAMDEQDLDSLRKEVAAYIVKHRLTPDEIEGKLYRLSIGRVLYIAVGLTLIIGVGVVMPVSILIETSIWGGLAATALGWWVLAGGAFVNIREAIAEHMVYSWCAERDIPRTLWLAMRDGLVTQMPPRTRWFARFVDPPPRDQK
jgi:hypothetical protein